MKKFLTFLMVALMTTSLLATVAEARRFGGGSSFGKQRTMQNQQQPRQVQNAQDKQATSPAKPAGNKWMGPLAGLAIGAGLMAMFSGGMGGGFSTILMALLAAGLVMFLISRLKKPQATSNLNPSTLMQYAGESAYRPQDSQSNSRGGASDFGSTNSINSNIPASFPVDSFIRSAKASFIRLQAANDNKDSNDIREYTTPEVFAEITMQMQERGNTLQKTDVIDINAELLEVIDDAVFSVASVRFTGQLRENNESPENIDEVWIIQKHLHDENAKWLLAGIQQTNLQ
ncbi:MAG: Tim44-like domain-containing protein [Methylotenera sp.]|uniref:Tim44 domain-containing protein n=1 Tax=Methylotenera sp. TaxID=2051956 RepID=UPI002489E288|nr:Tim44-like domain-containing protein [Methylotenera sp.]MDI1307930.1 Tim44-like domain-containing protein [Methylotenera sp.]